VNTNNIRANGYSVGLGIGRANASKNKENE